MWVNLVQVFPFLDCLLTQQQFKVTHVDFQSQVGPLLAGCRRIKHCVHDQEYHKPSGSGGTIYSPYNLKHLRNLGLDPQKAAKLALKLMLIQFNMHLSM